jgi:mannitol/fructose-specific phosphotransferase system IIA component (Ntr-type)
MPTAVVNLTDLLSQENIALDLPATTKQAAIEALVGLLARSGRVSDAAAVVTDVLERERLMSTGVGSGVAIPHAQSRGAQSIAMALGRTRDDIDFKSLDNKPVGLIFLIVAPDGPGGFVRILARISRLLYSGELQSSLRKARTADEVIRTIAAEEAKLRS